MCPGWDHECSSVGRRSGFDDIPLASWVHPRLTSVRQDVLEIARVGARFLDERMTAGDGLRANRVQAVTPRFLRRESTGPAPPR